MLPVTLVTTNIRDSGILLREASKRGSAGGKNKQIRQFGHTCLVTHAVVIFKSECRCNASYDFGLNLRI